MFTETVITADNKTTFYETLNTQLHHLLEGEPNAIANLSNMSSLLSLHLSEVNWAGFYLWYEREQELILGPFQGKPACIRIPLGKGVCGTAAQNRQSLVVEDVQAFSSHIACDPASRSEVVVPIVVEGKVIGVLDIDSPIVERFDAADKAGLEQLVQTLIAHTDFTQVG